MSKPMKPENPAINILFNLVIPVVILNKGGQYVGPLWALFIGLAFPLGYGIYDLILRKTVNTFSVIGLLNIGFTGGLAVAGLTGHWFAVKEAAFPLLLGVFVLWTANGEKPFIEAVFMNPRLIRMDLLREGIAANGKEQEFRFLLRRCTQWLSLSFLVSAVLNFVLALRIFQPLPTDVNPDVRSNMLNEQIAEMTQWSMPVILVPSLVILIALFYYLIKGLERLSGCSLEQLMQVEQPKSP